MVQMAAIRLEFHQQVDVALLVRLSSGYGPEDAYIERPMTGCNAQNRLPFGDQECFDARDVMLAVRIILHRDNASCSSVSSRDLTSFINCPSFQSWQTLAHSLMLEYCAFCINSLVSCPPADGPAPPPAPGRGHDGAPLPEHCMMQEVHSGVVAHSEGTRVRIEGSI